MMKNIADSLEPILKDLQILYTQLVSKLDKPQAPDNPSSRKTISQLSIKIHRLIQMPKAQKDAKQNKEILLQVYRSHLTNYLNYHLIASLIKCYDDSMFIATMTAGWAHFKRFVSTYHTLLMHANDFYEKESSNIKKREPTKEPNVLPVSALSLNLFNRLVIARYQSRIDRICIGLLQNERERQSPQDENMRTILEMLWSCCLRDLGRMTMQKDGNISFWREQNKNIVKDFKMEENNQATFLQKHLKMLTNHGTIYYTALYWDKLNLLNAKQRVEYLDMACCREQELSRFQMPSKASAEYYLRQIRKALLSDLEGILGNQKGFRHIFMECAEHFEEVFPLAMLYFSIFKYIQEDGMSLVCRVLASALMEKGNEINSKMGKPREYVTLMLNFKKSVRSIFDAADTHWLEIEQTMEKTFKKLLESLECTKNLAEHADFTIKECIRLKLDDDGCQNKFRDILFLLMSVSAKDSFLLHYQQYLAKRLIESLNQPRIDIENIMLRLIGEQLGNLTINHHLGMVKDIEKSIVASEQIHNNLPFISYKWDLRVFNPACWPESTSRLRFAHTQPPRSIKMHSTIIEDLYLQHFGAKLKLKFDKGTSLFEGRFPTAKVKFQAENSYLMILLHLSERKQGTATMAELRKVFQDKKQELRTAPILHLVQVLLESRLLLRNKALLLRNKAEGDIAEEEQIRLNYEYKPAQGFKPQVPIIIKPSMALMKLFKENNIDESKIIKEREKLIDAMLVKLLKHANSTKGNCITFVELFEGIKSNTFLANLDIPQSVVKQRLEYLIVKEFCKRNEDDRRIYHYIA